MYIKEIVVRSYRHLENVTFGPFVSPTKDSDLVCLAGPNGSGKSSVLELIGYALSQHWSLTWNLNRTFPHSAFEIAVGVTSDEIELARRFNSSGSLGEVEEAALELLEETGHYWRGFNYPEGEYAKNQTLQNKIHDLVTRSLRSHYKRSLGFFLKSDRAYSARGFDRSKLFNFTQTKTTEYAWSMAFNTSEAQYTDIFEFLLQQRYHFLRSLGSHHHKRNLNHSDIGEEPKDPLIPYNELLQQTFPDYSFAELDEDVPSNLFVKLPDGQHIQFHDLSSGEKEVFFVLAFFLRHAVQNAMIIVDEPEMHLHPELSRLLVRQMLTIKPSNQIWLATHNPEIIDEAGADRTIYIARDVNSRKAVVTLGSDEAESIRQLRNLFGFSGYLGIGRSMVFLEGEDNSSDRKMFSKFFPQHGGQIRFVPSKSSDNILRLNQAVLSILEDNVGWMKYYLVRDRDYLPDDIAATIARRGKGRIHILSRYHIENYLLDFDVIATLVKTLYEIEADASSVEQCFKEIAIGHSAEFLRDIISFRLNLLYRAEDFSLTDRFGGVSIYLPNGSENDGLVSDMRTQFADRISTIKNDLDTRTSTDNIAVLID
ncbi:AAA family ATPase [Hoeflea sp.]|uniref:AAA family ATPase n=1 Tax=Hoeflea sp. TaxID=1940281 RepID=UPI003B02B05F